MTTQHQNITFQTQTCTCCADAQTLIPREDLPGNLAVCPESGRFYRPEGTGYVPTDVPNLRPKNRTAEAVQVDLNRYGYA